MMQSGPDTRVKVADYAVRRGANVITTIGLGSCVAIALYDSDTQIGALAHILLPSPSMSREATNPAKFPETIVPVMLGDSRLAMEMAKDMLAEGIYVVGFYYPVVPKGQARIRVQMSAVHDRRHLEAALAAFAQAGRELGLLG